MRETPETGLREHVLLFSRFLRNPRTVGAVTASSRALAEAMVEGLDLGKPGRVVELGPGTGSFTATIISRLGPSTEFLAIDIDPEFVNQIRRRWPDVQVVLGSAEQLDAILEERRMLPIDHIVSGLPFVSLLPAMTKQIVECVPRVLRPGGTFTTFQYLHAYAAPSAIAFRRDMNNRLGGPPEGRLVIRNVLPAMVLTWRNRTTR